MKSLKENIDLLFWMITLFGLMLGDLTFKKNKKMAQIVFKKM